jgi:hypothetical protein
MDNFFCWVLVSSFRVGEGKNGKSCWGFLFMFLIFKLDVVHLNIFLFQIILFDKRYFYYKPTFRKEVQHPIARSWV